MAQTLTRYEQKQRAGLVPGGSNFGKNRSGGGGGTSTSTTSSGQTITYYYNPTTGQRTYHVGDTSSRDLSGYQPISKEQYEGRQALSSDLEQQRVEAQARELAEKQVAEEQRTRQLSPEQEKYVGGITDIRELGGFISGRTQALRESDTAAREQLTISYSNIIAGRSTPEQENVRLADAMGKENIAIAGRVESSLASQFQALEVKQPVSNERTDLIPLGPQVGLNQNMINQDLAGGAFDTNAKMSEATKRINRAVGFSDVEGYMTKKQAKVGAIAGLAVASLSGIPVVSTIGSGLLAASILPEVASVPEVLALPKEERSKYIAPLSNTENIIWNPQFTEAYKESTGKEYAGYSWVGKAIQEFPGGTVAWEAVGNRFPSLKPNTETFRVSMEEQGYSGETSFNIRQSRAVGEFAAVVYANIRSEILGEKLVGGIFKGTSGTVKPLGIFGRAAAGIAPAGAMEGAMITLTQETSRFREPNLKNIAIGAGIGAGSAALIGGAIAGLSPIKPRLSKGILIAAYTTDPFEYPGDVLARQAVTGFGLPVLTPTITTTALTSAAGKPIKTFSLSATSYSPASTPSYTSTISDTFSAVNIPSNINIPTNVPSMVNVPANVPTNIPTNIPTNVPTNVPTIVNVPTEIPAIVDVPTNVPALVTTPTNVPTSITINVPTVVPYPWLPPIIPLKTGDLGTGTGWSFLTFGKKTSKYFPSLAAVGLGIKGGKPGFLSGLEVRPIPGMGTSRKKSKKIKMPKINLKKIKKVKF